MLELKKSTRLRETGENVRKRWGMRRGARLWSHSMTEDSEGTGSSVGSMRGGPMTDTKSGSRRKGELKRTCVASEE